MMNMNKDSLKRMAIILVVIGVVAGFIYEVYSLFSQKSTRPEKKIQPIQLLKPPPPPPPPPKVEKPLEPVEKEKIKEPEPEPEAKPEEPPPNQDIATDQEAAAGDNGFGLRHGEGGDGPPGGGGNGTSFERWYGGLIKNALLDILNDHEQLRRKSYSAYVDVWLKVDGSVERVELSKGSGDEEIDSLILSLLNKFKGVSEAPPPSMKQPVKLKINSRA